MKRIIPLMPLFDEMSRTDTRPRRHNEATFDYLNVSARPAVEAVRILLEGWYAHLPEAAGRDLRARFRSRKQVQHQGAFFELYWHEFLLRCGYKVGIHPALSGLTTTPDFLAIRDDVPRFYLEATLAMPAVDFAADRRLAELHDTLNRTRSPDFFVSIEYRGAPSGNVKGRRLRELLERWLDGLDHDEVSRLYSTRGFDALPTFSWSEDGLYLVFSSIPKGPATRGVEGIRPVGIVSPEEMKIVRAHDDLKVALNGKAKKYGTPQLPLVVAVNHMGEFFDDVDLKNALFGEEQVEVFVSPDDEVHQRRISRRPNGFWVGHDGPRSTIVSAVLVTNQLVPWTLRASKIELIHNPWAVNALPTEALPISQRSVSLSDGAIRKIEGIHPADLLGVPTPWPAQDV